MQKDQFVLQKKQIKKIIKIYCQTKKYFFMYYVNFSEKQILEQVSYNSHLGQGVKRLRLKEVRCTQDYVEQGRLIYQKGHTYQL